MQKLDWDATLDSQLRQLKTIPPSDRYSQEPDCRLATHRLLGFLTANSVGETVGPYRLEALLGEGGMGAVYRACHVVLKQRAAVKLIHPKRRLAAESAARFQREIEALGRLSHRNIVRALHAGEDDSRLFLAMEYIEGVDLASLVGRRGCLPVGETAEIGLQTARGLLHAHQEGILHRDVKPTNLMLSDDGTVKVLDLGLAKHLDIPTGELTEDGLAVGTTDYIAPEQLQATCVIDHGVDIYGLGATLYYLLTGTAPFDHRQFAGKPQQIAAILHSAPLPLSDVRRADAGPLDRLVDRMIARDRDQRPESMEEVIGELVPIAAGPDSLTRLRAGGVTNDPGDGGPPQRSEAGTRQWVRVAGGLCVLVAGAAALALAATQFSGPPEREIGTAQSDPPGEPGQGGRGEPDAGRQAEGRPNRAIAAEVLRLGGSIYHGPMEGPTKVDTVNGLPRRPFVLRSIDLSGVAAVDVEVLGSFGRCAELGGLVLEHTSVDDGFRALLPNYPRLRALYLSHTPVTDDLLPHLGSRKTLRGLGLSGTAIGDAKIASLAENPHLEKLLLNDTRISDSAIERLHGMPELLHLEVAGTGVSDRSTRHLSAFPKLRYLDVRRTRMTRDGVADVRRALPGCRVVSSFDTP